MKTRTLQFTQPPRLPTDSAIWGSYGNIISFASDGDMLAGGLFGIKRWNIGQDN